MIPHTAIQALDIEAIRKDYPILSRFVNGKPLVYLDNAASSQKPNQVLAAMERYYHHTHANVHRGVHQLSQEATTEFEAARHTIARFINAGEDAEVIFTKGTTESINLVAYTFGLSQLNHGDEIIVSGMEHHSNIVPWQIVCGMKGAHVTPIPVDDTGTLSMDWLRQHITSRTRLIAVTHVSNALGTINPVREIIELAHQHNIPVLLDGAQAASHLTIDVRDMDVDFYCFSSHKMYGPTGIGILYGKAKWLNALPPWQGGGEMIESVSWSGTTFNKIPFKFEAGTPDIAGAIGLAAACEYLNSFDRNQLLQHEHDLLAHCTAGMEALPGVRTIGRAVEKTSVYSFVVDGIHPYDLGTLLDQQGIAVRTGHHCAQPLMESCKIPGTVRASFSFYNTIAEVDQLVAATRKAIQILS